LAITQKRAISTSGLFDLVTLNRCHMMRSSVG